MNIVTKRVLLFAGLITVDVLVFTMEKIAAGHSNISIEHIDQFYFTVIQQSQLWIALLLAPIQFLLWTRILKITDLSLAYPLLSLNYPFTLIAAILIGEHVTANLWIGSLLIMFGAMLVTSSDITKDIKKICQK